MIVVIILEMSHGRIYLNSASAAASAFCEWVQVRIDVYISNRKYQVKPHSSPWFWAACAAATVHCPSLPRILALRTFCELSIVLSTKINLLYLLYSTAQRCCLLHLIKQNCLPKTFLRTLILMNQVSFYLFSLLDLMLNCIFL